jgi:uncharacterized protein YjbJ (UPF0337 family)
MLPLIIPVVKKALPIVAIGGVGLFLFRKSAFGMASDAIGKVTDTASRAGNFVVGAINPFDQASKDRRKKVFGGAKKAVGKLKFW